MNRAQTAPFTFFFLALPYGISGGYVAVTLPFVLTRAGFSVATSASIVAIGFSANVWRFLWGPVADLTLTLRRWYAIGVGAGAGTLLFLSFMPLRDNAVLPAIVLLSQVAGTLVVLPVGGLMAHTVPEEKKGAPGGGIRQAVWVGWAWAVAPVSGSPTTIQSRLRAQHSARQWCSALGRSISCRPCVPSPANAWARK